MGTSAAELLTEAVIGRLGSHVLAPLRSRSRQPRPAPRITVADSSLRATFSRLATATSRLFGFETTVQWSVLRTLRAHACVRVV